MIQRRIDELGRIVIPSEMRDSLGITTKTLVSIELKDGTIFLKKAERTCKVCGSSEDLNDDISVCASCISKIKEM